MINNDLKEAGADAPASKRIAKDQTIRQMLAPFLPFLQSPDITEFSVNGPGCVWTKGAGDWTPHDIPRLSEHYLASLVNAIVSYNGVQSKSIVYAILPDGERCIIVRPPACIDGMVSIVVRKHAQQTGSLDQIEASGAFQNVRDFSFNRPSEDEAEAKRTAHDFTRLEDFEIELLRLKRAGEWAQFLRMAVLHKRNIIISGKTGSGKTYFTRSLIEVIPTTERLISIEEIHELQNRTHPNRLHMLYGEGAGRVPAVEALRACMKQSPDRIFLAELTGDEAWEYINSLNTGHPGSITTAHANDPVMVFQRVAGLVKGSKIGRDLDMSMIKEMLYTTIDVTMQFHKRKLTGVFYDPIFAKSKLA
jgi:type IV secretion system protein VirB11